ncbi:hypothetical protein MAP00_008998 [Monascus purpureus]|nr:hypothetical protein MAP00_008998 [Monascus purpureus]
MPLWSRVGSFQITINFSGQLLCYIRTLSSPGWIFKDATLQTRRFVRFSFFQTSSSQDLPAAGLYPPISSIYKPSQAKPLFHRPSHTSTPSPSPSQLPTCLQPAAPRPNSLRALARLPRARFPRCPSKGPPALRIA